MPDEMTLEEFENRIGRLDEVSDALKDLAYRYAVRLKTRAAEILRSKTHGTGKTARSIHIVDQTNQKRWYVVCEGDPSDPANLPMWLEYGTVFMTARAYMRPAADELDAPYHRDMLRVAEDTLGHLLLG